MPQHPGSLHNPLGGGSGFSGASSPSVGPLSIPQEVVPTQQPGGEDLLNEIIQMLRGGQVGAEGFMELLGLLAQQTLPGLGQPPQGPQGPQPQQGQPGITDLIGGQ